MSRKLVISSKDGYTVDDDKCLSQVVKNIRNGSIVRLLKCEISHIEDKWFTGLVRINNSFYQISYFYEIDHKVVTFTTKDMASSNYETFDNYDSYMRFMSRNLNERIHGFKMKYHDKQIIMKADEDMTIIFENSHAKNMRIPCEIKIGPGNDFISGPIDEYNNKPIEYFTLGLKQWNNNNVDHEIFDYFIDFNDSLDDKHCKGKVRKTVFKNDALINKSFEKQIELNINDERKIKFMICTQSGPIEPKFYTWEITFLVSEC